MTTAPNFSVDLSTSFQAFPEGVIAIDVVGRISFSNPAADKLLGHSGSGLLGQPISMLFLSQKPIEDFLAMPPQLRAGQTTIGDCCLQREGGQTFMSEVLSSPLYDSERCLCGHLLILRDITEQSTLEALAGHAANTLEDALEAITEGFALYDRHDRLVICNNNYREIYKESAEAIVPGNTFEDIIRYGLERGQYNTGGMSNEEWLAERVQRHQNANASVIEQNLSDGRWLQIAERRTRSGGVAGIRTDITALKNAQAESKQAFDSLETMANSLSSSIVESDPDGHCRYINEVAAQWLNATRDEFIGQNLRNFLPAAERKISSALFKKALEGTPSTSEINAVFPDGVFRCVLLEYIPKRNETGKVIGVVTFGVDISERKRKEKTLAALYATTASRDLTQEDKIRRIVELGSSHFELPIGVIWEDDKQACAVSHFNEASPLPDPALIASLGETYCSFQLASGEFLAIDKEAYAHPKLKTEDPDKHLQTLIGAPIIVDGKTLGKIAYMAPFQRSKAFTVTDQELIRRFSDWISYEIARKQDHDALMAIQTRLEAIASTDDLTGLLNRRAFLKLATRDIARYRRTNTPFSVLMMDIDHFKSINDNFGHAVGDAVLKRFAEVASPTLRAVDIFGRVGGEEFCIVLHNTTIQGAYVVAERLRKKIAEECLAGPMTKPVTCSIGITEIDKSDVEISSLLQRADSALYESKQTGRNRSTVYAKSSKAQLIASEQ